MPEYSSKREVEQALKEARQKLVKLRAQKPRDEAAIKKATADCAAIQHVLDRVSALGLK